MSEHWTKTRKRNKLHALLIRSELSKTQKATLPCTVTFTRQSPMEMDDDNFRYSLKAAKDCVADWLVPGLAPGRADGDKRINWHYKQEKGHPFKLMIEINQFTP